MYFARQVSSNSEFSVSDFGASTVVKKIGWVALAVETRIVLCVWLWVASRLLALEALASLVGYLGIFILLSILWHNNAIISIIRSNFLSAWPSRLSFAFVLSLFAILLCIAIDYIGDNWVFELFTNRIFFVISIRWYLIALSYCIKLKHAKLNSLHTNWQGQALIPP